MIRLQMEPLAEAELALALARDPRTLRANFLLGQLALFRGQLDAAVERSTRELALNPSDAMASYQLGDALLRQNRGDEAIAALQRSLWLNPFYSGPYILLGRAYMKKGQPATAEGMLRRAIDYDPNNRAAHYLLAQLLQQLGRAEEAKQEFAIAERLDDARRASDGGRCDARRLRRPGGARAASALALRRGDRAGPPAAPWPVRFVDVAAEAGLTQPITYGDAGAQALHHRDQRLRRGDDRPRRRRVGRPRDAERHPARARRRGATAPGRPGRRRGSGCIATCADASSTRRAASGLDRDRLGVERVRRRRRRRRARRSVHHLLRPQRPVSQPRTAAASRTSPRRPVSRPAAIAGAPAVRCSTSIATATSICSSPTICRSIWRRRPSPGRAPNCSWKGLPVNCGPKGLATDTNLLYRNDGDGTFTDVSAASGVARVTGRYSMTAAAADFDGDGWIDIYVATDSTAAILYRNNHDGTFTDVALPSGAAYNELGVAAGRDGAGARRHRRRRRPRHPQDALRRRHSRALSQSRPRAVRGRRDAGRPRRRRTASCSGARGCPISTTTAGWTCST